MKTLAFGEILWDKIEGQYYPGGTALNFAGHMAQLGGTARMISRVGDDDLGRRAQDYLDEKGILRDTVGISSRPTGTVDVFLKDGLPDYIIHEETAWDHITLSEARLEEIRKSSLDCFYFGTLAQRSPENRLLLKKLRPLLPSAPRFCDVNIRQNYYSRTVVQESLEHCDILKLNDEEQPLLSRLLYESDLPAESFFSRLLADYPLRLILFTRGKDGADCLSRSSTLHQDCGSVPVADTVGAGDSFSAGFMYAYHHSGDPETALSFAVRLADFVVSSRGALPAYSPALRQEAAALFSKTPGS